MKVTILGTEYELIYSNKDEFEILKDCDGFTDSSVKKCIVDSMDKKQEPDDKQNLSAHRNRVARHEIIHAYLEESGLSGQCEWATEEMVDWLAVQFPKIARTFRQAEVAE